VILTSMRVKVLNQFHDQNSHHSHDKVYATIRTRYFWPRLYNDCRLYCKTCRICQQVRYDTHPRKAPMITWPIAPCCSRWHMDIAGPIKKTKEGYQYILLCVESLSRWPEAFPLKTMEASEVADVLFNQIFCRYGAPEILMSDRGQNFMSKLVTRLCTLFSVRRVRTSGYRPMCNSACENFNRTIWKGLKSYVVNQEEWNDYLQPIMLGYRATVNVYSTQYSPYHIMFGREIRLPLDVELDSVNTEGATTADEYMRKIIPKIKLIHEVAAENVKDSQSVYKERCNKSATETNYQPGDVMWLFTPPKTEKGNSKKLQIRYDKLVYIKEKCLMNTYRVIDKNTHTELKHLVHSDRLKPYYPELDSFPDRIIGGQVLNDETDDEDDKTDEDVGEKHVTSDESNVKKSISKEQNEQQSKPETKQSKSNDKNQNDNNEGWYEAKRLLSAKMINNKRYYEVEWAD